MATITSNAHQSKIYVLSGPGALRPADQVRVLAIVLEKPLSFEAQPDDEAFGASALPVSLTGNH